MGTSCYFKSNVLDELFDRLEVEVKNSEPTKYHDKHVLWYRFLYTVQTLGIIKSKDINFKGNRYQLDVIRNNKVTKIGEFLLKIHNKYRKDDEFIILSSDLVNFNSVDNFNFDFRKEISDYNSSISKEIVNIIETSKAIFINRFNLNLAL